jgi:REP element-mobilizing transposase RayT
MRLAREKVINGGCYYHLMNRVAGDKQWYPFKDVDKEYGMNLVQRLSSYYLLEFISMCWMGNHYHIVLYTPHTSELPTGKEIVKRHNDYYGDEKLDKHIQLDDKEQVEKATRNMADISHFMKNFQQQFSTYINHKYDRRGTLWADRFKSTILEGRHALWQVVEYIELNSVRAGLVESASDYRHSTWGWYKGSGKHIFNDNFIKHMKGALGVVGENLSDFELYNLFGSELVRIIISEKGIVGKELHKIVQEAKKGETMPMRFLRRTRHWTDGGIIGSKAFVQEIACQFRDKKRVIKKQFSHGKTQDSVSIYCYKMLRNS